MAREKKRQMHILVYERQWKGCKAKGVELGRASGSVEPVPITAVVRMAIDRFLGVDAEAAKK